MECNAVLVIKTDDEKTRMFIEQKKFTVGISEIIPKIFFKEVKESLGISRYEYYMLNLHNNDKVGLIK